MSIGPVQWNTIAYSIGEATLGVGGLFLCSLLFRTRLIPRFLAVAGFIGYVSLIVGMIVEIFGIHISLMLSIPGIFFKVGLPPWLFTKGFQPAAYSGRAELVLTPAVATLYEFGLEEAGRSTQPWLTHR